MAGIDSGEISKSVGAGSDINVSLQEGSTAIVKERKKGSSISRRLRGTAIALPLLLAAACGSPALTPKPSEAAPAPIVDNTPVASSGTPTPDKINITFPTEPSFPPKPEPTSTIALETPASSPKDNMAIVREEIEKLGIEFSPTEERLWAHVVMDNQITPAQDERELSDQAMTIIKSVLEAMGKSENTYFTDAHKLLKQLQDEGLLSIYANDPKDVYAAETGMEVKNGKARIFINFSPKHVLENIYLLNKIIVHEMKHVEQFRKFMAALPPDLPPEFINQNFNEWMLNIDVRIADESEAYGAEDQAFTVFAGQTNYLVSNDFDATKEAAKLVTCDFDPKTSCWIANFPPDDPRVVQH